VTRRNTRPTFDEIEAAPVATSRVDGLTDAQWIAREERRERNFRAVCGLVFGALVGALSVWHWGLVRSRSGLATLLVVGGSMALFAALFVQRRDREALGHAAWILFPQWSLLERLPLWAIAAVFALGIVVVFTLAAVVILGHFHFR
jgi:hypothetical protein